MIVKQAHKKEYATLSNKMLRDPDLSFKETGLLCYLLSLPPDWNISGKQISEMKTDGINAVYSGMNALIEKGYIRRRSENVLEGKNVSESGKDMGSVVKYCDVTEIPFDFGDVEVKAENQESRESGNLSFRKPATIKKERKEGKNLKKEIKLNYIPPPSAVEAETQEMLKEIEKDLEQPIKDRVHLCYSFAMHELKARPSNSSLTNPPSWKKTLFSWLAALDKLERLDGVGVERLAKIHRKVVRDEFWSKQIRAITKYRQKDSQGQPYFERMAHEMGV